MDEIQTTQTVTAVVLWVGSFLASAAPWFLSKLQNSSVVIGLCNSLAGGTVLGAAFSHLLHESDKQFAEYFDSQNISSHYPFAALCAAGALMLLVSIDALLSDTNKSGLTHSHGHVDPVAELLPKKNHYQSMAETNAFTENGGTELSDPNTSTSTNTSKMYHAYIFFIALSIHSLLEGLGLGAQTTETGLVSVMIAIISHKMLEAFALGVSVFNGGFTTRFSMTLLFVYSLMTPIGIAVGMVVAAEASDALAGAVLTGLAAGSFFYVALIEVLPSELKPGPYLKWKIALVWLGWAFMTFIAYYAH